jgi:hypothetical protein
MPDKGDAEANRLYAHCQRRGIRIATPLPSVMADSSGPKSLAEEQDLAYQQREWLFERCGWIFMTVVVCAAMAGLLGRGPLSHTTRTAEDGTLRIEFDRFLHLHDPTVLVVRAPRGSEGKSHVRLWIDQEYLDAIEIRRLSPEPQRIEIAAGGQAFLFPVDDSEAAATVVLHAEPNAIGALRGKIGLQGRPPLTLDQFVLP